jgi:hypothetical protein
MRIINVDDEMIKSKLLGKLEESWRGVKEKINRIKE